YFVFKTFVKPQAENTLKFVDHPGHAGAAADDDIICGSAHMSFKYFLSFVVRISHCHTGMIGVGMGICNNGIKFGSQLIFNFAVKPATCCPVGIEEFYAFMMRGLNTLIYANYIFPKGLEIRLKIIIP